MISVFFDRIFTMERLMQMGDKSQYGVGPTTGACMLRQASNELTRINSLQFGELWELFVEAGTDIVPTDRVIVDGVTFTVKGIRNDVLGSVDYMQVLLVKQPL